MSTKKLYKVHVRGLNNSTLNLNLNMLYAVAENLNEAYNKVREYLNKKDYGFSHERELKFIELLAEDVDFPESQRKLFL